MTYIPADPNDPPMVIVTLDDGSEVTGFVRAQEKRHGNWVVHVQTQDRGTNQLGTWPAERVRVDETDYSRGREV